MPYNGQERRTPPEKFEISEHARCPTPGFLHHDPSHFTLAIVVGCGVMLGAAIYLVYRLCQWGME